MHYLVTGGAGFIGSHLAEALLKRGDKVRILDNFSRSLKSNVTVGAKIVKGSVTKPKDIAKALKGIDGIFHCAALPSVELSFKKPEETLKANLIGTLNVLRVASQLGVKRFILSSSAAVYGDQEKLPFTEEMKPNPGSPYALEKYAAEEYCKIASVVWGVRTVCLRYFNVYGPRAATEGAYVNVIPIFLRQRAKGVPLTITGKGTNTRDYIYVDDVVAANLLAMDNKKLGRGEIINIGSGVAMSTLTIARYIGGPTKYIPPRIEQKHARADISKARKLLNWEPEIKFSEGLKRTMEWFNIMKYES